jgi:hypothetical protein|tara:strand:+ start:727 stop:1038 length:312 start_codon:yes stop_codon:yes gene_type:complete
MSWKIINMEHNTSDGFVIEVTSAYEKQDGAGYASDVFLNNFEDIVGPDFIPYEDLTENLVIGWVKDALGPEAVAKTELEVDTLAATKKEEIENPQVEGGLPWV